MDSNFLSAARGEKVTHIPVWFMRQAGRSLPGYRELRKKYDVITLTQTPELAAKVSIEPITRLGVDAAILFADIMLLPIALGEKVSIVESVGPVLETPINRPNDVARLKAFSPDSVTYLAETIRILKRELSVPVIGFCGAPFTLASYLIEGKPSRDWLKTKRFMLEHSDSWNALMEKLVDASIGYARVQVEAGANAFQVFDSWIGCLSPEEYRVYVLPHMLKLFSNLTSLGVPRIHFGTHTAGILSDFSSVDAEVIGVDWRIGLGDAKMIIGDKTLQGNLDPAILLAPWHTIQYSVDRMLEEIDSKQGYICNLGHGVLPATDDAILRKLVEYVHNK